MITLTLSTGKTIKVEPNTNGVQIAHEFDGGEEKLAALLVNNQVTALTSPIPFDATVSPIYFNEPEGSNVYRRTLCFILAAATHKLWPGKRLIVGHSLGYAFYYIFESNDAVSKDEIDTLKKEMRNIIETDAPIIRRIISYAQAKELLERNNQLETRKHLDYVNPNKLLVNTLGDYSDMNVGALVNRTGKIKNFNILPYQDGFLLQFPTTKDPEKIPEFTDHPKIFQIYKKYKNWGKQIQVTSVAAVNELIANRKINDFVDITETFQAQNFADTALQIQKRGNVRVVLIAGPSSSGKTTSAKKLSLHLQALGYTPRVISLDNYYVGRDRNPKDENGNYDYECLEALDIELLNKNLVELFDGKEVQIPSYNFDLGQPYYTGETMKLQEKDILIMEGIHGLNDKLTPLIKNEYKFKVYLSALTQLNIDDHNRVSTRDNRLIRRIVRDSKFRGKSAAATIGMWASVQRGERKYIFPYQNNADSVLNTALDYELSVLKVYAEPLLRCVTPEQKEYAEASRLLQFLSLFSPMPSDYVPVQSIVREFIGGSTFKY
ncbi:MAG: nucleoside kinase [Treponema sp.]|nr:nucleoside kinase [Treponema sp.]